ncbi:MAG: D-amino acid dehydrogenase [Cellvibrio sp.]|uniref:D-amino acid dehydrogenase n=1 Tax=Cellvibrio sp. TaxID=1965322 RepID=UPI0027253861|nr:D-amino acid dehydrogenase [Cellvibrio sp.]
MKIAIVGAGVIGVTTAYELATDGHEVTVFERHRAAAEEASFANAGVIAPGYIAPWAAPGMPFNLLSHLFSPHAPVKIKLPLSTAELGWIWRWYRASKLDTYLDNRTSMQNLASYSRERLRHISTELELDYERSDGLTVLLRTAKDANQLLPCLDVLSENGIPFSKMTPEQTRQIEPALNPDKKFFGAVHLPTDEVGNCREFVLLLKKQAQQLGVKFEFNSTVASIEKSGSATLFIENEATPRHFEAIVLCAGAASAALLKSIKPLKLKIPLIPVYGYSVTAVVRENMNAPSSALIDERYKVVISRLGNRVRVAGSFEIGGPPIGSASDSNRSTAFSTLYKVLQDWFPGAAHTSNTSSVQEWRGARPMLPDGPPVIGASGIPGIWLNLGHGSSGWALSCGSARAIADLIAQRQPDIDLSRMTAERFVAR